jgi:hypothetical protein
VIPPKLQQALERTRSANPIADRGVRPGDVRKLSDSNCTSRFALVLTIDSKAGVAEVTLIHPYVEYATDLDVIVHRSADGPAFDLVVQTDIRAAVSTLQLDRLIGVVTPNVVSACLRGADTFDPSADAHLGAPLTGPMDARWEFKVAEGKNLIALSAKVTAAALDDSLWELDADEVFSALLAPAPDADRMIEALIDLWSARPDSFVLSADHIEVFERYRLHEVTVWSAALGEVGTQFYSAVLTPMIESVRCSVHVDHSEVWTFRTPDLLSLA